jgi:hypothetical protein
MKFAALLLLIVVSLGMSDAVQTQQSNHVEWVSRSLSQMQQVKAGMTRADLEKVFVPESGLQMNKEMTYVYRGCPYFKVDVEFEQLPNRAVTGQPDNKIVKISKPYIDELGPAD